MIFLSPKIVFSRFTTFEFVDVRSSFLFAQGHLSGALSIPITLDAVAWKKYLLNWKKESVDPLRFLPDFDRDAFSPLYSSSKTIVLYTTAGDPLNSLLPRLLHQEKWPFHILEGGYEAFLREQDHFLATPRPYYLLCGLTGVGKTKILRTLAHLGERVLDLEQIARHRGSVFGQEGPHLSPSDLQQEIILQLQNIPLNQRVFLEQKGAFLGTTPLASRLIEQIQDAKKILLQAPCAQRIQHLLDSYRDLDALKAQQQLAKLKDRLSPLLYKEALQAIQQNDRVTFADHLLRYYDQTKQYSWPEEAIDWVVDVEGMSVEEVTGRILDVIGVG